MDGCISRVLLTVLIEVIMDGQMVGAIEWIEATATIFFFFFMARYEFAGTILAGPNFLGHKFAGTCSAGPNFRGHKLAGPILAGPNFLGHKFAGTILAGPNFHGHKFAGSSHPHTRPVTVQTAKAKTDVWLRWTCI